MSQIEFDSAVPAITNIWAGTSFTHTQKHKHKVTNTRSDDVFKSKLLTFVYESINKLTPICFHNFFCHNASIHSHSTRQSTRGDLFLTQRKTLQYDLRSI